MTTFDNTAASDDSGNRAGLDRALALLRSAAACNADYTARLAAHGVRGPDVHAAADFARVPILTKPDLLAMRPFAVQLAGHPAEAPAMVVASSGSSGRPTYWLRGPESYRAGVELFDRLFRTAFETDRRRTLVIVCFAMGTWTGGTYTLLALLGLRELGHDITVITPGVDLAAVGDALATLGPEFDRIVLAGYPPHVRDVLAQASEDVLRQDIRLMVGGEPTSEEWRDYALGLLGRPAEPERVVSIYGSSESAFVGNETPATIAIRRAARADRDLAEALFDRYRPGTGWIAGDSEQVLPTLVEYDPEQCYIEVDPSGFLLFTVAGLAPLVRYRVDDQGAVFSGTVFANLLRAAGRSDLAAAVRPDAGYLVLYGRTDVAAIFSGANIYPAQLQPAFDDAGLADAVTGKFALAVRHDADLRQRLELRAELRPGVAGGPDVAARVRDAVIAALLRANSEYRVLRERRGAITDPVVLLEPFGTGTFRPAAKQRRVERAGSASLGEQGAVQHDSVDGGHDLVG